MCACWDIYIYIYIYIYVCVCVCGFARLCVERHHSACQNNTIQLIATFLPTKIRTLNSLQDMRNRMTNNVNTSLLLELATNELL